MASFYFFLWYQLSSNSHTQALIDRATPPRIVSSLRMLFQLYYQGNQAGFGTIEASLATWTLNAKLTGQTTTYQRNWTKCRSPRGSDSDTPPCYFLHRRLWYSHGAYQDSIIIRSVLNWLRFRIATLLSFRVPSAQLIDGFCVRKRNKGRVKTVPLFIFPTFIEISYVRTYQSTLCSDLL